MNNLDKGAGERGIKPSAAMSWALMWSAAAGALCACQQRRPWRRAHLLPCLLRRLVVAAVLRLPLLLLQLHGGQGCHWLLALRVVVMQWQAEALHRQDELREAMQVLLQAGRRGGRPARGQQGQQ